MTRVPLHERAHGRWYGILTGLGLDRSFLTKRNGPCPMCGGKDRFRWTDHNGTGGWICNQCGHGDGAELVKQWLNLDFKSAAKRIEEIIGACEPDIAPKRDEEAERRKMAALWERGRRITPDCPVGKYLSRRRAYFDPVPSCLRWVDALRHPYSGDEYPAMIAKVIAPGGAAAVNIHRTWVTRDGVKAPIDRAKMVMSGAVPSGSFVPLSRHNGVLGVAEGIETAIRAGKLFGVPTWSCLNAMNMVGFEPPEGVSSLVIFGDNDASYTGQAASYALAKRIAATKKTKVSVMIPEEAGKDWADD